MWYEIIQIGIVWTSYGTSFVLKLLFYEWSEDGDYYTVSPFCDSYFIFNSVSRGY